MFNSGEKLTSSQLWKAVTAADPLGMMESVSDYTESLSESCGIIEGSNEGHYIEFYGYSLRTHLEEKSEVFLILAGICKHFESL